MNPPSEDRGRLVVLEGPDSVGKSTLAGCLSDELQESGVAVLSLSFPGRRPGTLGELVYRLHHQPEQLGVVEPVSPASVQLLHVAAHIDVIESSIKGSGWYWIGTGGRHGSTAAPQESRPGPWIR